MTVCMDWYAQNYSMLFITTKGLLVDPPPPPTTLKQKVQQGNLSQCVNNANPDIICNHNKSIMLYLAIHDSTAILNKVLNLESNPKFRCLHKFGKSDYNG